MANLQYMPGDPRLVDQLVYELKSKGIFDQLRKECIADVDTRPAYQNLRQRVESSVCGFLSRQLWKPDLNKNQLREKLRKHILDGNYLEQGVERIVDQVVNPKVTSVFIPQVEDLAYNYLGIPRKKTSRPEATEPLDDLLPTYLEAVSPGSVKSNDDKSEESKVEDMEIDSEGRTESIEMTEKNDVAEISSDSASMDKSSIPLPAEEIRLENIPAPDNSPNPPKIELENIELPREPNLSTDIPLPDESSQGHHTFKALAIVSEDSNSSSGSSIRRNMSPITPVRNFDDENSCDAQQGFENDSDGKADEKLSNFRFSIESKESVSNESEKDQKVQNLSYKFNKQVNLDTYNTPLYDDSSNSHNLQIDYESDASKTNHEVTLKEVETTEDAIKEKKDKNNHKSSHRSRDSSRHSSSKDGHSSTRDSKHDKKSSSSKDDKKIENIKKEKEKSKEGDKKDRDSSHRTSHKSSSSKDKHRSSSSSHRHSSKSSDDRKSTKDKEKSADKDKDRSSDKSSRKESKSSHRDKDRKSNNKDKKKDKKDIDDHYSSSGRGNHTRRSTDRDSNDGSSSSKGSQNQSSSKSADSKKDSSSKSSSSKDSTSNSGESTSPSDKEQAMDKIMQLKPIRPVRVDKNLEIPIANPPRLPFVPDVTLKKPKYAANFEEAKRMMKMRRFLAEEQKRMNQEAALLLEFQANVRPSLSQVYSSISGPELEFACLTHTDIKKEDRDVEINKEEAITIKNKNTETAKANIKMEVLEEKTIDTVKLILTDCIEHKLAKIVQSNEEPKQMTKETIDMINEVIGVTLNTEADEHKYDAVNINEAPVDVDRPKSEIKCLEQSDEKASKSCSDLVNEIGEFIKATDKSNDSNETSLVEDEMSKIHAEFEVSIPTGTYKTEIKEVIPKIPELQYFGECDKFNAELECQNFSIFFKEYMEKCRVSNKMYLINCDTYEENVFKQVASTFGEFEIVNYYKNGHLVPNTSKNVNIPSTSEISLPIEANYEEKQSVALFSPVKSECSFELSSDYDSKLDEIVNKKSRQEVMEIILGGVIDESTNKMLTIDYYTENNKVEQTIVETDDAKLKIVEEISTQTDSLKRKNETLNNNRLVLTPNKIRKMSDSDQISSTTGESEEISNNNKLQHPARSKFLGRAKRVGLPRPKKCAVPNSPSSDKSVENYANNTPPTLNGKLKSTPRSKVQRYDTSDLYKPKLHYLSRRNMS